MRALLMLADREEISRGLAEGLQYREIGLRLGRESSVISREVGRHGGRERYRVAAADSAARAGRERPKLFAVERSPRLRAVVCQQLREGWSPASIAGRLPTEYAADESCRVSHEAIYQWVYAQPVSTLARELISLRTGRKARKGGRRPSPVPRIREPVYIDERPGEVEGRQVPGHWEGDRATRKSHVRSDDTDWRLIDEGVTRASVEWSVPALACVMGDRGVRSPGEKPKPFSFHPGMAGEGKTGRVNASESSYAS